MLECVLVDEVRSASDEWDDFGRRGECEAGCGRGYRESESDDAITSVYSSSC